LATDERRVKVTVFTATDNGGAGGAVVTGRTATAEVAFYANRDRAIDIMFMLASEDTVDVMVDVADLRVVEKTSRSLPSTR
jgi:hypothetical protein